MLTAKRIVRDIADRSRQPGDSLPPEKEMLELYEVGRGTLREALRILELQGVLRIRPGPGGGPVVASPDSRHLASTLALLMQFAETPFRAVIEARLHIEPITAGLCAERATPDLITDIRECVDVMARNVKDIDAFLDENRKFHDLVAWGSGNPIFGYFINSLHWITDGTVLGVDYPKKFREIVLEAHEKICVAIEARDGEGARGAMYEHMENTQRYFERLYRAQLDEPLSWELYGI
jgi:GntR family transcriptional repressor for pyruvate dehydrogenase complex